jgi:mono/diheme cytochrome c family protein
VARLRARACCARACYARACAGGAILTIGLVVFACSPQGGGSGASTPAAAAPADLGARLYTQNCVPCHREDGAGVPTVYPALAGSQLVQGDPVELAQWVLSGKRPPTVPAGRYSTQMLVFGWMKDPDAAALLTYVRSHFGNAAPAVDAATVAKAR